MTHLHHLLLGRVRKVAYGTPEGGYQPPQQASDNSPARSRLYVSSKTPSSSESGGPSVLQCSPSRQILASLSSSCRPSSVGMCTHAPLALGCVPLGRLHTTTCGAKLSSSCSSSSRPLERTLSPVRSSRMARAMVSAYTE